MKNVKNVYRIEGELTRLLYELRYVLAKYVDDRVLANMLYDEITYIIRYHFDNIINFITYDEGR